MARLFLLLSTIFSTALAFFWVDLPGSEVLTWTPLVDGHNNLPFNLRIFLENKLENFDFNTGIHNPNCTYCVTSLRKMRMGRVGAQVWSVYVPCTSKEPLKMVFEQIDVIRRMIDEYSDNLELVTTSGSIMKTFLKGKIGSLISVDGGHSIDSNLAILRTLYELGVRSMALTHNCHTLWAESSGNQDEDEDEWAGGSSLLEFGKVVVMEMNRLGMIIDISHASKGTAMDVLHTSLAPVISSHSTSFSKNPNPENIEDDVLLRMSEKGGMIMLSFDKENLGSHAALNGVIDHLNYLFDLLGADHIGLGASFDKGSPAIGLDDPSSYTLLFDLLKRNHPQRWTDANLEKLAGNNFIRVFGRVEEVKDSLVNIRPYEILIEDVQELPERSKEETTTPTPSSEPTNDEDTSSTTPTTETSGESPSEIPTEPAEDNELSSTTDATTEPQAEPSTESNEIPTEDPSSTTDNEVTSGKPADSKEEFIDDLEYNDSPEDDYGQLNSTLL